jgi:FkbM family methyltransferase
MKIKILLFIFLATMSEAPGEYPQMYYPYFSQGGQDIFFAEFIFKDQVGKTFVDIGAHDGISYSNTYYLEKNKGWRGICVEPTPNNFTLLKRNRPEAICFNGCIYSKDDFVNFIRVEGPSEMLSGIKDTYNDSHMARAKTEVNQLGGAINEIKVEAMTLNTLCKKNGIFKIDLLCVDTEGSEEEIIMNIDFNTIEIDVICVENNYNSNVLRNFLFSKGFVFLCTVSADDIFVSNKANLNIELCKNISDKDIRKYTKEK